MCSSSFGRVRNIDSLELDLDAVMVQSIAYAGGSYLGFSIGTSSALK